MDTVLEFWQPQYTRWVTGALVFIIIGICMYDDDKDPQDPADE